MSIHCHTYQYHAVVHHDCCHTQKNKHMIVHIQRMLSKFKSMAARGMEFCHRKVLMGHIHVHCIILIINYSRMRCMYVLHPRAQIVGFILLERSSRKGRWKGPTGLRYNKFHYRSSCVVCNVFTCRQLHKPYTHMLTYCMSRLLALLR